MGKKIPIKGMVTKIEVDDPNEAWMELGNGIRCNFTNWRWMAEQAKVGETIDGDGSLKRCDEGDISTRHLSLPRSMTTVTPSPRTGGSGPSLMPRGGRCGSEYPQPIIADLWGSHARESRIA